MNIHTTTTMEKNLASLTLGFALLIGVFMPATALAYLTPDQVFGGANLNLQPAPPTQREGTSVIQQQQEQSATQRTQAQSSLQPVDAVPQDRYVPAPTDQSKNLFDDNTQYEIRQQRIQESKSNSPTIIIGTEGTVMDANGNILHSGAPRVSSTGPESILAGLAMVLAGICTFAFAHFKSRKSLTPDPAIS